jgi:hypothetical protein
VLVTPETGNPYYAVITRADNPTVEGTPFNKASILKDATAAMVELTPEATPDDMFKELANRSAGGGGSGGGHEFSDLDDIEIVAETFVNAGAGWQTRNFPRPFSGVPTVTATVGGDGFYVVGVNNVTATSFQYRVLLLSADAPATTTAGTIHYNATFDNGGSF